MRKLCLTGWQQPVGALAAIAPDAVHFDYAFHRDCRAMLAALPETDIAIGWSLGGQLLARAVAGNYIRPKLLVLLGAPFQCVASEAFPWGMEPAMLDEFSRNYRKHPEKTLEQFCTLMGLGDAHATTIIRKLQDSISVWPTGRYWLEELAKTTCSTLDFKDFPPTVIVHGLEDNVIDPANAQEFSRVLPASRLYLWEACGHAPHLHNPEPLRDLIASYV